MAPESWRENGGAGTIEANEGTLIVTQTENVQRQVLLFLERLRAVRHKPARDREDSRQTALATPRQQARRMLDRPIAVNFHEPTPLAKILVFLSEATDSDILIDHVALAAAESSDRVEATLTTQQKAFGAALTDLLRPLGLTYRVVGAKALQVTTREVADERLDYEFYGIAPFNSQGHRPGKADRATEGPRGAVHLERRWRTGRC